MVYGIFRKVFGYTSKEYSRLQSIKNERIRRKDKSVSSLERRLEERDFEFDISLEEIETQEKLIDTIKNAFLCYRKTAEETLNQYRKDEKESREFLDMIKGIIGENKYQKYSELIMRISELKNKIDSTINASEMLRTLSKYPDLVELKNGRGDHIKVYINGKFLHNLPHNKKSSHRYDTPRIVRTKIKKALAKKLIKEID